VRTENLIEFQEVTKIYQAGDIETHAINNVSLDVKAGEYIAITGPSGCGKSSILSVMGLLDKCSSGRYLFKGEDVSGMSRAGQSKIRNTEIGFVFQSFNLIDSMSVFDNIALPLRYREGITEPQISERVRKVLEHVGMAHRMNHFPSQLSGGQQQRVAVARAFVVNPSIILADEPTGNLDSKSAETVMELLKRQHDSGVTICIVTHDPRYTADATRTLHVLDGSIEHQQSRSSSARVGTLVATEALSEVP
jgi:putative ABC transport system ATP-binding protein